MSIIIDILFYPVVALGLLGAAFSVLLFAMVIWGGIKEILGHFGIKI